MATVKYTIFILLVILISLFAAKNMHTVEVYFFNSSSSDNTIKVPTMILISGSFGLGFLIVWFFELFTRFKLKAKLRMQERRIKLLEKEILNQKKTSELDSQATESPPILEN